MANEQRVVLGDWEVLHNLDAEGRRQSLQSRRLVPTFTGHHLSCLAAYEKSNGCAPDGLGFSRLKPGHLAMAVDTGRMWPLDGIRISVSLSWIVSIIDGPALFGTFKNTKFGTTASRPVPVKHPMPSVLFFFFFFFFGRFYSTQLLVSGLRP